MGPLPATGKRAQFDEIVILQIRDGKVLRQRGIVDNLSALKAARRRAVTALVIDWCTRRPPNNRLERTGERPAAQR